MVADSFGEGNYQIFRRGNTLSAVFRETYHADGPDFNNAYRTFTFDMSAGRRLQLSDLVKPGVDPLAAIPPLAQPFVEHALDQAPPPHQPGTYPFVAERWTPDKVYSGGVQGVGTDARRTRPLHAGLPGGAGHPARLHPGVDAVVDGRRHRRGAHSARAEPDTAARVRRRLAGAGTNGMTFAARQGLPSETTVRVASE